MTDEPPILRNKTTNLRLLKGIHSFEEQLLSYRKINQTLLS